jgi:5,10-methylenetetrahydrofolate reductase
MYIISIQDKEIKEIVSLPVEEHYDALWDKVRKGFEYVYTQYFYDYDWFLKADDDT